MDAKTFIKRTLLEKSNILFSAIRMKRAIDLRKRKQEHSWKAMNYKIYPSSINSLHMCPKKFIEVDIHKPPGFELETVYKMEVGKIVHTLLQDKSLTVTEEELTNTLEEISASYLEVMEAYIKQMYKQEASTFKAYGLLYNRPRDLGPMLEEKLAKTWPEIPGWEEESGISFRCDLVLNVDGDPGVIDIKTTSVNPDQWTEQLNRYPLPKHKLQVRFYRHLFNKANYFDKPVRHIGLGYVNLLMDAGSEGSEVEFWEDLGSEPDYQVEDLIKHLTKHRTAFLEGRIEGCTYSFCKEHSNA